MPHKNEHQSRDSNIYDWSWFGRGAANLFSLPAIILISAFVGFGGLVREAGIPLSQLLFMIPAIWALPSHLILVAGIVSGASILTIAIAVTLASIRMLPMTMALIPGVAGEGIKSLAYDFGVKFCCHHCLGSDPF